MQPSQATAPLIVGNMQRSGVYKVHWENPTSPALIFHDVLLDKFCAQFKEVLENQSATDENVGFLTPSISQVPH